MPGRGRDRGYKGPKKKVATPKLSSQPDVRRGRGYQPATVNDARRGRGYKPATLAPVKDERAEALAAAQPPPLNRPTMYTRFGVAPTAPSPFGGATTPPQGTPTFYTKFGVAPLMPRRATGTIHDTGVSQPSLSARHGWHYQTMLKLSEEFEEAQKRKALGIIPEAQGMLASPPPEVPTEPYAENGGYGYGYGGYGGGGGGGGDYTYPTYSNPFSQYQPGYAAQGSPGQAQMGIRTAAPVNQYKPYATQNQAPRGLQLLTNWRI